MRDQTTPHDPPDASRMSEAARQRVRAEIAAGRDQTNPVFLYSTTAAALLLAIAAGLIDPVLLARREIANRGLDADGAWCGFDEARRIHGVQP
jgi:hypothetical protein